MQNTDKQTQRNTFIRNNEHLVDGRETRKQTKQLWRDCWRGGTKNGLIDGLTDKSMEVDVPTA